MRIVKEQADHLLPLSDSPVFPEEQPHLAVGSHDYGSSPQQGSRTGDLPGQNNQRKDTFYLHQTCQDVYKSD